MARKNYSNYNQVKLNPQISSANISYLPGTNNHLLELNNYNAQLILNLIDHDSSYSHKLTEKIFDYHSSLNDGSFPLYNKHAIEDVLIILDLENSTQKWRVMKEAIFKIAEYICDPLKVFFDDLKKENSAVVDKLVSYVRDKLSRTELSICSKACRFFEKELYGKDVFYAYDGVVIKNLPYYANQLGITIKGDYSCYSDFHADMENIRTASGGKISRFELDQMIWYAHK